MPASLHKGHHSFLNGTFVVPVSLHKDRYSFLNDTFVVPAIFHKGRRSFRRKTFVVPTSLHMGVPLFFEGSVFCLFLLIMAPSCPVLPQSSIKMFTPFEPCLVAFQDTGR